MPLAHNARMREALFLAIAVTAFVGAAFVPGGAADNIRDATGELGEAEPRVLHAAAPERRSEVDAYANWNAGATTIDRSGDGHFYAQVTVNGAPVEVLVDTGASMVALTASDAQALGLSWNDAEIRVIGSGASGPVMGVPVRLDRVELGGHEASGVEGVIIPEGLGISLLGQSFLSTVNPVRIEGDRMVLGG